ncbi:MAG: hypothetical protein E3J72_05220 [Planctomycetota bacterium]|nr:MAG: hypothetical protein E3J72_05220 [Planctomycetota bacterium]
MASDKGMKKLASQSAPEVWEKYSSEFEKHVDAGNFDGQFSVFNRFLEELGFLFKSGVSEEDLVEIAMEASKADVGILVRKEALVIWGKYLLDFSRHERDGNNAEIYKIFKKFLDDLKAGFHPQVSEEDLIKTAEDVMGRPDMTSPEGCMAELLATDDDYIGILEPNPNEPGNDEKEDSEPTEKSANSQDDGNDEDQFPSLPD